MRKLMIAALLLGSGAQAFAASASQCLAKSGLKTFGKAVPGVWRLSESQCSSSAFSAVAESPRARKTHRPRPEPLKRALLLTKRNTKAAKMSTIRIISMM